MCNDFGNRYGFNWFILSLPYILSSSNGFKIDDIKTILYDWNGQKLASNIYSYSHLIGIWMHQTGIWVSSVEKGQRGNISFEVVRNHVKLGVSLRVLYCVVDTGYGLGRSLGDCRPALPKGRKYQMVKTQTESHDRRPVVWTNQWQICVFFSFEVRWGTGGICHAGLGGFSEAL